MPHFIIDCSPNILKIQDPNKVMKAIHEIAVESQVFDEANIKVRMNPYEHYLVAGEKGDFIHLFGNIMSGRDKATKAALSKAMISKLQELFPDLGVISMNIRDFEKETYCNLKMLD